MAATDRKIIKVSAKRIDVCRALHNKTPEQALELFEKYRAETAEFSFIYRYNVRFIAEYGDVLMTVTRDETDAEYDKRMEKNRKISEKKKHNVTAKVTAKELAERKMLALLKLKYDIF